MAVVDLASLPNKTIGTLSGGDQILLNASGSPADVTVAVLTQHVEDAMQPALDALASTAGAGTTAAGVVATNLATFKSDLASSATGKGDALVATAAAPGGLWTTVRGFIAVVVSSVGASIVGASGGAWTSVQGFIAAILGSSGASLVGYLPEGVGAFASTVNSQLNLLSVHVANYGAVANGSTDDTAAVNAAILAAQKLKANQLSYDEIYSVDVVFDGGKDYKIVGPILLPSGIILRCNGARLIGNNGSAGSQAYNDALPSIIESGYYDGATITTNRAATLNTKRLVNSGIERAAFVNANCGINVIQMNEGSFIRGCTFSNCSAAARMKWCYYLTVDSLRVTSSASFTNQYAVLMTGGNHNAMKINRVFIGSGSSVGIAIDGAASSGTSITNSTFEESTGTGIYFGADASCLGWGISNNYFEGIRYGIVTAAGSGVYGAAIDNNFFSSCEYAILASANSLRVASFKGNAQGDGGGVIRNLVDLSATGNDVVYQLPIKTANTTSGPSAFLSNIIPSNSSTAETDSFWTRVASPYDAIGRAGAALANQTKLNVMPFEGANIVTVANEPPFVSLVKAVNTLTINTQLTYDLANVLAFNFRGATDAVSYVLTGFIFGNVVHWMTHDPVGVVLTVNNNAGAVQLVFSSLPAAVPTINVSGMVRHV